MVTSVWTSDEFEAVLLVEEELTVEKKDSIDESSMPTLNFMIALFVTAELLKDIDLYKNSSDFIAPSPAMFELSIDTSWLSAFLCTNWHEALLIVFHPSN